MASQIDDIAKAIVERLPIKDIYDDVGKSSAKEIGNVAADLIKTLWLVLAPFQLSAAVQDRFAEFIDKSIRRVPEEQQIAPAPQILGPVLDGVKYEPEDTPIYEMFSQLLSRAMDRKHVSEAHPSYPLIIRQLSSDEAIILSHLSSYVSVLFSRPNPNPNFSRLLQPELMIIEAIPIEMRSKGIVLLEQKPLGLLFQENFSFYLKHLKTLGLVTNSKRLYEQAVRNKCDLLENLIRKYHFIKLTHLGVGFVDACTTKPDLSDSQ
jgi:Abortive infection alpha